jgi:Raf kinase inhibitor-like YbhB/YbcL family protein
MTYTAFFGIKSKHHGGTMRRIIALMSALVLSISAHAADEFAMNTNAFLDAGALPVLYTCDGKDASPQFTWSNVPAKTQSFALVVSDPDAPSGTFYHWVIYNLPTSTKELAEGIQKLPAGTLVGKNSFGKMQYNGPCPPKGTAHTYVFTLYALDGKLKVPAGAEGKEVLAEIKDHTVGTAKLTTVYSRWVN